jgi:SAM-dependent methyltransferase
MNLATDPLPEGGAPTPTLTPEYWEEVFAEEDPWDYGNSAYESWKFDQTLSLLPARRIARALELGCAEGHLTARLAPLVEDLTAVDISPTAIDRARRRCAGLDNVHCQVLNLAIDPVPAKLDLILCSEVLFYLPLQVLHAVAAKIVARLKPGGHLLLAHGNLISDDRARTGFDWGHPFGAKTIGEVFAALGALALVKEVRTPLFTVQLFRRTSGARQSKFEPELTEIPLPSELILSPEVERTIVWDGAETTRAEACATENATDIPILMYHSVADDGPPELAPYRISPRAFREQLRYLRRHGYYSTTVEEWTACIAARRPLPGRPVILTFDDG